MPRVLLACDGFKGSLTPAEVTARVAAGLTGTNPEVQIVPVPVSDGGDGFLVAAQAAGFSAVPVEVTGPTGRPVRSAYAVRERVAVAELADACGLLRLPGGRLDPLGAGSRGLGEVIAAALTHRPDTLVIGVGGSASTDGGAGMLAALGVRLLDASGAQLPDGGGALTELAAVDLTGLDPRLAQVSVVLATDVANPLLGPSGAAAVFGRQKGADPAQVAHLEAGLARFADLVGAATGRDLRDAPGSGAAGGVGYAALAVLRAAMRPGIEVALGWSRFADLLAGADLVVTGEGSLDGQTLRGKTVAGVARVAGRAGVPVVAVCGRCLLDPAQVGELGLAGVLALTDLEPDPAVCLRDAAALLTRLAGRIELPTTGR